jgi:hypothetical protein
VARIVLTEHDGTPRIEGDPQFTRCADPYRGEDGVLDHSLRAGWHWNGRSLDIFSDRLGMIPVFSRSGPRGLVLASSLAEIIEPGRDRLDTAALAVFMRLGFFLGDDTPLLGVRVLPPGLNISVTPGNHAIPAASLPPHPRPAQIDRPAARSQYAELFASAVAQRCTGTRVGVPLSGGRDSRHILLELIKSGRPPAFAVTSGTGRLLAGDLVVARKLCALYRIPHVVSANSAESILGIEEEKNRRTHFLTDEHRWYAKVAQELQQQGADLFFDGLGGDVLSNGLFFDEQLYAAFQGGDPQQIAECLLGPERELPFLSPRWRELLSWKAARERTAQEVARHLGHPNPVKSFYFWNRTRREIALAPLVLGERVQTAMPYVAPQVVEFLMSLPAPQFGPAGLHDELIATRYPGPPAGIEYATRRGGVDEPRIALRERAEYARLARAALQDGLAPSRFTYTRLARFLMTGNAQAEWWWLSPLIYLQGLQRVLAG